MADVSSTKSQYTVCWTVLSILAVVSLSHGSIIVHERSTNITVEFRNVAESDFGSDLPPEGSMGYLVLAKPVNACSPIAPPPNRNITDDFIWIALIARSERNSGCSFGTKVLYAQKAGYGAAIVYNLPGREEIYNMHASGDIAAQIDIPSVFTGHSDGMRLQKIRWSLTQDQFYVTIQSDFPLNLDYYLLPFAIVVGICFVLMLVFMLAKWVRDYRKRRKSRLSKANLKKIPVKKFRKGDNYDVCAICLDEYENGDKLRILPCSHAYHMKCVDPWLTNNKRTCPVCKRRVLPNDGERNSESEDSDDEGGPTETTPLLPPPAGNTRRSTFENSGLPISVQQESVVIASSGSTEGPDSPRHIGRENMAFETDSSDDEQNEHMVRSNTATNSNLASTESNLQSQAVQVDAQGFEFHPNYFELKSECESPMASVAETGEGGVRNEMDPHEQNGDDTCKIEGNVVVHISNEIPDETEKV